MRTLVTGGAGFIGSHVAQHCLSLGHKVVVLDDLSGGFEHNIPSTAHFIRGSIVDADLIERLFVEYRFDYVYHLAAYAADGLSHFIRRFNYSNNLIGSINLINAAVRHEVKCFVFTSSIAIYGAGQVPMDEEQTPEPEDPYGIAKYAVELDLRSAHRMFGLNFIIFRPHNVYGENQNISDRYRNVIGIFMNQVMHGQAMTVFGHGLQTRAFSYIDDVAPHIARSVMVPEAMNRVFNVGSETPVTVRRVAELVASAFEVKPAIEYLAPRNEVTHAFSNHQRMQRTFGAGATVSLEEGLKRMAQWVRGRDLIPVGAEFAEIELWKNMPPSWSLGVKAHR